VSNRAVTAVGVALTLVGAAVVVAFRF